jgi:hydrogenase-4 component F
VYFILLGAFWSSMLYTVTATSFSGLWTGISATTLATTFLVGFSGGKTALEAAWKYLILCSFGIAIALLGILLLGRAAMDAGLPSAQALSWSALAPLAGGLNVPLFKVAVVLIALGFATKAGLVPMHAWLPDAHSKAPAAISALLSGLLVSCSLYAIVRTQSIAVGPAGELLDRMLVVLGSLSVIVATLLMLAQRDVKRFLSYSTVEHSGLIAIALGVHTPLATIAALYHAINHAWAKSAAFLAIGVVQYARRGRRLFIAALAALAGLPPFGLFFSELLIAIAVVRAHEWILLPIVLVALLLGFAALTRLAIEMDPGEPGASTPRAPRMALTAVGTAVFAAILCSLLPFVGFAAP